MISRKGAVQLSLFESAAFNVYQTAGFGLQEPHHITKMLCQDTDCVLNLLMFL